MIQDTSREAYRAIQPKLGDRQRQVLDALWPNPRCSYELCALTGLPNNVVTPRIYELRKMGLVVESHRAVNPATNRTSIYWMVAPGE